MTGWRFLLGTVALVCTIGCAEPVVDSSAESDERASHSGAVASSGATTEQAGQASGSNTAPTAPASAGPSSPTSGSVEARPPERTVNPFGAAGLINPADPLLAGAADSSSRPPAAPPGSGFSPAGSSPPVYNSSPGYAPSGFPASSGPAPVGNPPTVANTPGDQTVRVPAGVGVGRRGRSLDQFQSGVQRVIAEPAKSLFATRERIVFNITIPHAMQLYQAEHGYLPRSHEEFMRDIIEANQIRLPELPAGHRYVYDPQRGELMVERPAR